MSPPAVHYLLQSSGDLNNEVTDNPPCLSVPSDEYRSPSLGAADRLAGVAGAWPEAERRHARPGGLRRRPLGPEIPRTLARLRALRSDLIDPTIAVHRGRVVKRTGAMGRSSNSAAWSTRCAAASRSRTAMVERNAGVEADRRIRVPDRHSPRRRRRGRRRRPDGRWRELNAEKHRRKR